MSGSGDSKLSKSPFIKRMGDALADDKVKEEVQESEYKVDSERKTIEDANKFKVTIEQDQKQLREARQKTKAEVSLAEEKVAYGVQCLYQFYQAKINQGEYKYDAQGICTIVLDPNDSKITTDVPPLLQKKFGLKDKTTLGDFFPNGLKKGITLQFFREDAFIHPPIHYMISEAVRSYCNAAKVLSKTTDKFYDEVADVILGIRDANVDIHMDQKTAFKSLTDRVIELMKKTKQDAFVEQVKQLENEFLGTTIAVLYNKYKKEVGDATKSKKLSYKEFAKQLTRIASHHRSNERDILTFNKNQKLFSYQEGANVTAHDRTFDSKGAANLALGFDGRFSPAIAPAVSGSSDIKYESKYGPPVPATTSSIQFHTDVSYLKHSSLPPIEEISGTTWGQKIDSVHDLKQIDILIKTISNMQDAIGKQVSLRRHGQLNDSKETMVIDNGYQLLTSNAWNYENQATAYRYSAHATYLLNGAEFVSNGQKVKVNIGLMNAGINNYATLNTGFQKDTQRRQDRLAYLHLTDVLHDLKDSKIDDQLKASFNNLLKSLLPLSTSKEVLAAQQKAAAIQIQLKENSKKLLTDLKELETKYKNNKPTGVHQPKEEAQKAIDTTFVANQRVLVSQALQRAIDLQDKLREQTYIIERDHVAHWAANHKKNTPNAIKTICNQLNTMIESGELRTKLENDKDGKFAQQLRNIAALIYKSYMDDLYYSGKEARTYSLYYNPKYRSPEYGALFNAYMSSYQRIMGMMPSEGCKSANDRELVVNLIRAACDKKPLPSDVVAPLAQSVTPKEASISVASPTAVEYKSHDLRQPLLKEDKMKDAKDAKDEIISIPSFLPEKAYSLTKSKEFTNSSLHKNLNLQAAGISATIADTSGGPPKLSDGKFKILKGISNVNTFGVYEEYGSHKRKSLLGKFQEAFLNTCQNVVNAISRVFGIQPLTPLPRMSWGRNDPNNFATPDQREGIKSRKQTSGTPTDSTHLRSIPLKSGTNEGQRRDTTAVRQEYQEQTRPLGSSGAGPSGESKLSSTPKPGK